jgi:hypothetical protein
VGCSRSRGGASLSCVTKCILLFESPFVNVGGAFPLRMRACGVRSIRNVCCIAIVNGTSRFGDFQASVCHDHVGAPISAFSSYVGCLCMLRVLGNITNTNTNANTNTTANANANTNTNTNTNTNDNGNVKIGDTATRS